MNSLYLFAYLCIGVGTTLALEGQLQILKPCKVTDLKCLRATARQYLKDTSKDIVKHNIKGIDPLVVPQYTDELGYDTDIVNHIQDMNILGLKDLEVSDFLVDTQNQKFQVWKNVNVKIRGNVEIEYKKESKKFSGSFTTTGKALVLTTYPYELKKDKSGVDHFELGEEVVMVKVDEVPSVQLDDKLLSDLQSDDSIKESRDRYSNLREPILENSLLKVFKNVVAPALMNNLRQATRALPTSAFITL